MHLRLPALLIVLLAFAPVSAPAQALPVPTPTPTATATPSATATPTVAPSPSAAPSPTQPGGVVPLDVEVDLAGTVSPAFALARIRAAIIAHAALQPGVQLELHDVTIANPLAPGDLLEAQAGVHIAGRGAYLDVNGRTAIHLRVQQLPPLTASLLWFSDDPEYIVTDATGALFAGQIAPDSPVRIFLYHVAKDVPHALALVLTGTGAAPARVQILGAAVGPSPQFAYVGQQTSARFLLAAASQESYIVTILPGTPYVVPLGTMQPGDLIEGILELRTLDGGTLDATLVTAPLGTDLPLTAPSPLPDDTHGRRGIYALETLAPIDLSYTAGSDAATDPFVVGTPGLPSLEPDGHPLAGDYGVLRQLTLHLANPTDTPATAYLYETVQSPGATFTIWFSGDPSATLLACSNDAQPHLVRAFPLAAGATQVVSGSFMSDGGSSYPLQIGLSGTAPLPAPTPGGC